MTVITLSDPMKNLNFNSHAHVERDPQAQSLSAITSYFNSHAHVERDKMSVKINSLEFISTHTLTWSVTTMP